MFTGVAMDGGAASMEVVKICPGLTFIELESTIMVYLVEMFMYRSTQEPTFVPSH
jgi:hypothetical protein